MLCKVIYYAAYKIIYKAVFICATKFYFYIVEYNTSCRYNIRPLNGVCQWQNITMRLYSSSSDSSSDSSSSDSDSDTEKTKSQKYVKNSAANKENLGSFLNNMIKVSYNFQLF